MLSIITDMCVSGFHTYQDVHRRRAKIREKCMKIAIKITLTLQSEATSLLACKCLAYKTSNLALCASLHGLFLVAEKLKKLNFQQTSKENFFMIYWKSMKTMKVFSLWNFCKRCVCSTLQEPANKTRTNNWTRQCLWFISSHNYM